MSNTPNRARVRAAPVLTAAGEPRLNIKIYILLFAIALTGLLAADAATPWIRWNTLEKEIRDCRISPNTARSQMSLVHAALLEYCTNNKIRALSATSCSEPLFPIEGYTHEDI